MIEAVIDPIRNGAVGEDGSKAASAGFKQIGGAPDVQETLMLTCKACGWEVFRRGGATHGDRNIGAIVAFELCIGFRNLLSEPIGTGRVKDYGARFRCASRKRVYAGLIDRVEEPMQSTPGSRLGQRVAVCVSR